APGYPATVSAVVIAAMMLAVILAVHLSARRKLQRLRPILADATRTDQRMTVTNSIASLFAAAAAAAQVYLRKPHVGILSDPMSLLLCLGAFICASSAATSLVRLRQRARQRDGGSDLLSNGLPRPLRIFWTYAVIGCLVAILSVAVRGEFSDGRRGLRYEAKGEHDNAIASFSNAIAAEPDNPDVY